MTAPFIGTLPHGRMEVASMLGYAILFRTASSTRLTSSSVTSKSSDEYGNQTAFPTDRVRPPHATLAPAGARAWRRSAVASVRRRFIASRRFSINCRLYSSKN